MEGLKFFRPQNTAAVSQEKGYLAISQTTDVIGDQIFNVKEKICSKTINRLQTAHLK